MWPVFNLRLILKRKKLRTLVVFTPFVRSPLNVVEMGKILENEKLAVLQLSH